MDLTEIFIALGGASGVGALIKAILTGNQTKAITDDRKISKENYEARFASLEAELKMQKQINEERNKYIQDRLDEGSNEFKTLTEEMKTNNALLNQLLGALGFDGRKVKPFDYK